MTRGQVSDVADLSGGQWEHLSPGEEIVLTRNNHPVARLVGEPSEKPHPVPGRGKGMLTILSEDDDHLKDFAEYMP